MARNMRRVQALEEPVHHVNRNLLIAGGLLLAAIVAWSSLRNSPDPAMGDPARGTLEASREPASRVLADTGNRSAVQETVATAAPADTEAIESDLQFQNFVDDKYRFLLRDVRGARRQQLLEALLARERVVVQINTAKQADDPRLKESLPALEARKLELDRRIGELLPASELAAFEALKDSDIERFQVEDYAGGISNVAPLSEANKQAVLSTKLAHRQRFRRVLEDSRLMTGELNATERQLAFNEVSRALTESHQGYLQEVRQYLYDDEQFTLLSNYETTEYNAELAKLRTIAGLD